MLGDDLNFGNNGEESTRDPCPQRPHIPGPNILHPTNIYEHEDIGETHVRRVREAPLIGIVPNCIERTEAYYRIQNLKILEQCKRYKDSLFDCQSSLKVATDALRVANKKNETIPDYPRYYPSQGNVSKTILI